MNADAATKIKLLEDSQKCLAFGLISLVTLLGVPFSIMAMASREPGRSDNPIFVFCFCLAFFSLAGLPCALLAMVASVKVRARERELWNAARPYRIVGGLCAMLALIASFIIMALIAFMMLNSYLYGG